MISTEKLTLLASLSKQTALQAITNNNVGESWLKGHQGKTWKLMVKLMMAGSAHTQQKRVQLERIGGKT